MSQRPEKIYSLSMQRNGQTKTGIVIIWNDSSNIDGVWVI